MTTRRSPTSVGSRSSSLDDRGFRPQPGSRASGTPHRGLLAPERTPSENAFMTTSTVFTMVLIIGFVWGGFSFALFTAVRKEAEKGDSVA